MELLGTAQRISGLALSGARRSLLRGLDLWPDGHHVAVGGLRTADQIERERAMSRVEVDALPSDASARLALAVNVARQHAAGDGGGGGGGSATELVALATSPLQRGAIALAASSQWAASLSLIESRLAAAGAAAGAAAAGRRSGSATRKLMGLASASLQTSGLVAAPAPATRPAATAAGCQRRRSG